MDLKTAEKIFKNAINKHDNDNCWKDGFRNEHIRMIPIATQPSNMKDGEARCSSCGYRVIAWKTSADKEWDVVSNYGHEVD